MAGDDVAGNQLLLMFPGESGKHEKAAMLAVTSKQGKVAIVAVLDAGDFFGEGRLAGQPLRMATAGAVTDCALVRIEKSEMARMLQPL